MGVLERYITERNEKAPKNLRGPFMSTEAHREGRFHRLSPGRAAHYENIKPHNPSRKDWYIPADIEKVICEDGPCSRGQREGHQGKERWK